MKQPVCIREEDLLAGLLGHDERAFSVLYDNYAPTLLRFIGRLVRDEGEAENLLQDTFVKVWKNIHQYDASRGRLFAWLLQIARNTAINYLRSGQYLSASQLQTFETAMATACDRTSLYLHDYIGVDDVVQQLEPRLKQVIDLIYFLGYTQQEVADELGVPVGAVKTRTRTALQQLKHHFTPPRRPTATA